MNKSKIIVESHITGLMIIKPDTFYDFRGHNFEGYNAELYASLHPFFRDHKFEVDSFSKSSMGVLRGFHGDPYTHKLIQVLYGKVQFVVIDKRMSSYTCGHVYATYLQHDKPCQILVPAGCVNAHLCLSHECVFSYKLSCQYIPPDKQIHINWLGGWAGWDIKKPMLSSRDEKVEKC